MQMRAGLWTACLVLISGVAWADGNDFRVYQLGNPDPAAATYNPEGNANFRIFARELAAALTSTNLTPPNSTGHSGFAVNLEMTMADMRTGGNFQLPTEQPFGNRLIIPSVHIRKGLPFSFEIGSRLAWIERSKMFAGTGEVKWALNEGFHYLPDLAARGFATRLFNSKDFDLTAAGLDLGIGKKFPLAGMFSLTPYGGWTLVWVSASSNLIDFRPQRTQAEAYATPTAQLQDSAVYDELPMGSNSHNRFYLGMRLIAGVVQITAEVSYAVFGKVQVASRDLTPPRVLTYNAGFGLDF